MHARVCTRVCARVRKRERQRCLLVSPGCLFFPSQAPGPLLPAPHYCQHLPGHGGEIYMYLPNKNILSREMAFREKHFPSQENLCRAAVRDQPLTSTTVNGLGFGKGDLAPVTVPGVGGVLPSLESDWRPDNNERQPWGLSGQGSWSVGVIRVLCCVGGWDASSSVGTSVLETTGHVHLGGVLYMVS